jgi:hypothetical protein
MKKLFKFIYLKRLVNVLLAISWGFFLTIIVEIQDDLNTVVAEVESITSELRAIDDKLKYDYNSIDLGNYESIHHYRYNNETEQIEKRTNFVGWTTFNVD